jgi:Fic family protein
MAEVKVTKKDWYAQIRAVVEASDNEQKEGILGFIDHEVELLEAKAAKAAERAASKKADGDELRNAVQAVLTDELQTIDAITAQIEGEDITKAKVTARLTQLVKAGVATKDMVKTEDGHKVTAYKLGSGDVEEEVTE